MSTAAESDKTLDIIKTIEKNSIDTDNHTTESDKTIRKVEKDNIDTDKHTAESDKIFAISLNNTTEKNNNNDTSTDADINNDKDHLDRIISERNSKLTTGDHGELENHDAEHQQSKFRILFSLLKKFIGVKDIVSLRISLPAQLIEPIGNLEYWNYNDRPDYFLCIDDSDDPLERMFAAIRWWYSKDLKFVKGKLIKPYNSILGEQFLCHWEVTSPKFNKNGEIDPIEQATGSSNEKKYRVTCLNEQISHHPPVSAFHYHCPEKGVIARGIDHIAAKFTGTCKSSHDFLYSNFTVKFAPGDQNKGVYLTLEKRDNEEYSMTHPTALLQGWLKGSLYVVVCDYCIIACPKTKLKAILEYKEERWLGKPRFAIEGKIFKYDPENDDIIKLKNVNEADVVAELIGSWRGQIKVTRVDTNQQKLLLDMDPIDPIPKKVKPLSKQGPLESRKVWQPVTTALLKRDYSLATKEKQSIEERQRQIAAELKAKKEEHVPVYFHVPVVAGKPELKEAALELLKAEITRNS
ncbi:8870_t:CDS:2 [Ambispora gerdemannii]|uniref:8870_t:CDS:1 n=1 Tax=Ambispora gerdemannii TaxID=144530 RepID=A0A9N8VJU6_9GLOM|nr:8870_t:CDS:2 [Ambispora gerdemannii]